MIQRIQTLFLVLCSLCFIVFLFIPLKIIDVDGVPHSINALSPFTENFSYTISFNIISGFIFLGISASLISIFSFKQRYLQIRFCIILIVLAAICLMLLDLSSSVEHYSNFETIPVHSNVLLGLIIPFAYLARVFIKRDIKLIRSASRIR